MKRKSSNNRSEASSKMNLPILLLAFAAFAGGGFTVMTLSAGPSALVLPIYEDSPERREAEILINQFTAAEFCGFDGPLVRRQFNSAREKFISDGVLDARKFRDMRHRSISKAEELLDEAGPKGFQSWCGRQGETDANFFINLVNSRNSSVPTSF